MLDDHALSKQIHKYNLRFKAKSWITSAIKKFITVINHLLKLFIHPKDP